MKVGSYVRLDGIFHDTDWEEGIVLEVDELGALVTITRMGTPRTFGGLYTYWAPKNRIKVLSE
jgi:hypothetical protein